MLFSDILQNTFINNLKLTLTNLGGGGGICHITTGNLEVILLWFLSSKWIDESHTIMLH